jgi:hypothetical protein
MTAGRAARLLVRATPAERAATLPGDELVSPADVVMDRAFDVPAPPDRVWPWIVQLGKERAGWYLPAGVERVVPRGRRALRHLAPRFQSLETGDVVPDWGGRDASFTVAEIVPDDHLLYRSTRGPTHLTWCLRLTALPAGGTRLHLRLRLAPVRHRRLAGALGGLVDLSTIAGLAGGLRERVAETVD